MKPIESTTAMEGGKHVPRAGILYRERGIGGGGDPAGERAGQAFGEIGRCVAGEMAEQVAADVAGDRDERAVGGIAADAPG